MPSREVMVSCLENLFSNLFPHHFPLKDSQKKKFKTQFLKQIDSVFSLQNLKSNFKDNSQLLETYLGSLPQIKEVLLLDANAALSRDLAAESLDEIILCYPGFRALMVHRLAHALCQLGVPILPRLMAEIAHSQTGCDIHPGAKIGEGLFIDHATGVVIGQTAVVGKGVTLFQGVTLGSIAISNTDPKEKRHPTLEDEVVVYSNATILGGKTVIGKRSIIGGSCWITFSVAPDSKVILANPRSLLTQSPNKSVEFVPNWEI